MQPQIQARINPAFLPLPSLPAYRDLPGTISMHEGAQSCEHRQGGMDGVPMALAPLPTVCLPVASCLPLPSLTCTASPLPLGVPLLYGTSAAREREQPCPPSASLLPAGQCTAPSARAVGLLTLPLYSRSAAVLGLSPTLPTLTGVSLLPQQVAGRAWALDMDADAGCQPWQQLWPRLPWTCMAW